MYKQICMIVVWLARHIFLYFLTSQDQYLVYTGATINTSNRKHMVLLLNSPSKYYKI